MKSDKILREFVRDVVSEISFSHGGEETSSKRQKTKSIWQKFKSLFGSSSVNAAHDLAEEWIEDQQLYYDIEISDDERAEIKDFAKRKMSVAIGRFSKPEMALKAVRRALDVKFSKQFKLYQSRMMDLGDDE